MNLADGQDMTSVETTPDRGRQDSDPAGGGPPADGVSVVVTLVEAPACHLCEHAKSALAVLAQSFPMTVRVLSIDAEAGRALMEQHRAPMSPLILLDGQYFSSGRLPRRKLERRLEAARCGETNG
jgi:glutaredoxin